MEFLNKVFEQRDKPISDSSKKLYTRNLMKLNNDMHHPYLLHRYPYQHQTVL